MPRRFWSQSGWVLAFWTLLGLFFTTQHYLQIGELLDGRTSWGRSLVSTMPDWYLWAALTPLIVRLAQWFPVERGHLGLRLLLHGSAATVISVAHLILAIGIFMALAPAPGMATDWTAQFRVNFAMSFHWNVMIYGMLVVLTQLRTYHRRSREEARRAWQLEARLAESRLQALQAQLHPHFLFNTLSTIAELVHERPSTAEAMIVSLGDLLRETLAGAGTPTVSVREELEYLRKYLAIEQIRFEDRLTVVWRVEHQALGARVPRLILQPLVENAVRHGVGRVARQGLIEIVARRAGERLRLEVRDNGGGLTGPSPRGRPGGLGLENTRARLQQLYGANQRFDLHAGAGDAESRPGQESGVVAALEIPFESAGEFRSDPARPVAVASLNLLSSPSGTYVEEPSHETADRHC